MRPFDSYLHQPEDDIVRPLTEAATLAPTDAEQATARAVRWVEYIRANPPPAIEGLLQDIGLASPAGLALMGLAEALLRIPDDATVNVLIEDKLGPSLGAHELEAKRLISRVAEFGLGISHRLLSGDNVLEEKLKQASLPFMRLALRRIVRRMGHNFIIGEGVQDAFMNAADWANRGHLMHYDMLGEGARTMADADRHFARYQQLIDALQVQNQNRAGTAMADNPGVSIKLTALHPRFDELQHARVMAEVLPRVRDLCLRAAKANIVLCIDAEEADRFELTLDIIEALALDPQLKDWAGLGFALQAYQTRARAAVDWFADLARRRGNKMTLRLVKGAYWDTEIKRGQERGLDAFPVFTRKASTDCSYIAIAREMLRHRDLIYPQFASHNALTHATITQLAPPDGSYEIQRLQGMGSVLFDAIKKDFPNLRTRIYAPVGEYEDLLTYLVRRLLENGANSNFVHQLANPALPVAALLRQPPEKLRAVGSIAHPNVTLPAAMFANRRNAQGWEVAERTVQQKIISAIATPPTVALPVTSVDDAFSAVRASRWPDTTAHHRAAIITKAAAMLEAEWLPALSLIVDEGKRTVNDAISEIREAVDFCRYYAVEAERLMAEESLPGPAGESNKLLHHPRGTFVCISPWNFPLAIFMGQVVAALVTGNTVVAKPAEQTPRLGVWAVALLHRAGVPLDALQCVLGDGAVGAALVAHARTSGVAFTGSFIAAKSIQRALAMKDGPIAPLIAETGGINAMIVDSSALLEQVTDDVLTSGFRSAGQRCSALRVLFVQDDIADKLQTMIAGAMQELVLGDPKNLATDIGPVIDTDAAAALRAHIGKSKVLAQTYAPAGECFIPPTLVALNSLAELPEEVFGPIVHIIRYKRDELDQVIRQINDTGYGLTFGLHTRIMTRAQHVAHAIRAGNVYVNRSMIGAVVGVQPFGGEGLSGTGPKAGGPAYLRRFVTEQTITINTTASGGNVALLTNVGEDN
jgi:RHH-type proline utilization regulon transcriptional repressor/proline dehydrogenase/delta 1-pyrroline-5-carboxylate dehydrogenase